MPLFRTVAHAVASLAALLAAFWPCSLMAAAPVQAVTVDVCIYGGTSGGVIAAVQVARMGKRAVLLEPGKHLGGMTSGGLSAVDIGNPRTVGGLTRDYFTRLAAQYDRVLAWDKPLKGVPTGGAFAVEPHAAEQLFNDLIREAGVPVQFEKRLIEARKAGSRITEIVMDDGTTYRARMFIDATYEGDLLAAAGVTCTLTRESNAQYGESLNGVQFTERYSPKVKWGTPGANGRRQDGKGIWDRDIPLDPYVVPGDPASGVIPLVKDDPVAPIGHAAPGVQAYCYRLCLTDRLENRIELTEPEGYEPAAYELVARFIAACQAAGDDVDLRWFSKYDSIPGGKFDFNTATFGGNAPGDSWDWPEADWRRRREIADAHECYHRGLLWFLSHDPRVPEKTRAEMRRFGLCQDEFPDTRGWPHQLYIREARRMVSDLVMTEHHARSALEAPHGMGLASYGIDIHEIRRVVRDGGVWREGKLGGPVKQPYPVGYGAIVPRREECDNLLVTFAVSASHVAFGSIRMEPVFMMLSQSAATAACQGIEQNVSVQDVDQSKLKQRLLADGQVLAWNAESSGRSAAKVSAQGAPQWLREPLYLARAAKAPEVHGTNYDVVVVGGTPSGVATAVRAAREGLNVLIVEHTGHLGGMMTNGLVQWDALYGGHRAPIFTELLANIETYYRAVYGEDSNDFQRVRFSQEHYPLGTVEPHVAEREFNRLVAGEPRIAVLYGHYPAAVTKEGRRILSVRFQSKQGEGVVEVRAAQFVDAMYEGDLAALAGAPCRIGREARSEYGEPHAGQLFTNIEHRVKSPRAAVEGKLNIRPYDSRQGTTDPASPFSADVAVQAYNYRFCMTRYPANRAMVERPPGYDREEYVNFERKSIATAVGPNHKSHMNSPILPGENHDYPAGEWATRDQITKRHLHFGLGLIYFLQNDESIPEEKRREFRQWGLPKDEYVDHGHVPYEMYVRETRRIIGRHVYTERDNSMAPGIRRTPVHADSVAITDWYMDSHACTTLSRPGYKYDGKLILTEESRPGQIPYRALLPVGVDNLIVPVCMSTTHVSWGAVRLEPVWIATGEAAGFACAQAAREQKALANVDPERLLRALAKRQMLVSFFNDVDAGRDEDWAAAVQYFGARGYFPSYDARPREPLDAATAQLWIGALAEIRSGRLDATALARRLMPHEPPCRGKPIRPSEFARLLGEGRNDVSPEETLSRAEACRWMFMALERTR